MTLTILILIAGFIVHVVNVNTDTSSQASSTPETSNQENIAADYSRKLVMDPSMNLVDGNLHH